MARFSIQVTHRNDELTFADTLVTIGGRTGVDVVLEDVLVADRHCVVDHDDGFRVRDTGSVSGTWVDGTRATPSAALADGATIVVGTTRIRVAIDEDGGAPRCTLTVDPQSFYWKRPGKGVFDSDPDELVRSETRFGAFPALRLGNRAALVAGAVLLVAATLVTSVMEPLADPGRLQPTHAFATGATTSDAVHQGFARCVELAAEQGCDVCHTTGSGATETKCRQCHGLPGEMAAQGSFRHPYLNDGALGDVPGIASGDGFCVVCHTDHQGTTTYKDAAKTLAGDCAACHAEGGKSTDPEALRQALLVRAPIVLAPPEPTAYATYRFPHDAHLGARIDCAVCHRIDDDVRAQRLAGVPDDPTQHDFATVPYETCASCHVPGAAASGMTAAQQTEWRAKDHQWTVAWHGTDDGGKHCRQCHAEEPRDGATVIGPAMKTVERGAFPPSAYAAVRARYTSPARLHEEQFARHAGGAACTSCHVDGSVSEATPRPPRTFWHGLHLADQSLAPADARAAATISVDGAAGCASCHGDLSDDGALRPASQGAYRWPDDAAAQAACRECHRETPDRPLALRAVPTPVPVAERRAVADFPHDVHLNSASFGKDGALAEGCFACHEFAAANGDLAYAAVPITKPTAADCTQCHQGHDHVGGGRCRECHPAAAGTRNSFLDSARVAEPLPPTRPWPAANGFSHLSPGHDMDRNPELTCAKCHDGFGLEQAKTLGDVRVPDERAQLCRDCHLEKQFHWR